MRFVSSHCGGSLVHVKIALLKCLANLQLRSNGLRAYRNYDFPDAIDEHLVYINMGTGPTLYILHKISF